MDELLLTYYGDDFTGSTDVMETMAMAGLRAVLFLRPPEKVDLQRFPGLRAVGVSSSSRTMSPQEMDDTLPLVFQKLKDLEAPLFHYKTCSTVDSSPQVGSIGHASDLGRQIFRSGFIPMLFGSPRLARYSVFGNVFARSGLDSPVYRLDRHPTMSRHPITPMNESDVAVHLSRQTRLTVGLLDIVDLSLTDRELDRRFDALIASSAEIILFDVLYEEHLATIGRLIWKHASEVAPLFAVGSSGIESALTAFWRKGGLIPEAQSPRSPGKVEQIVAVSGSCSPVTESQIARAVENGFGDIPLDSRRLASPSEVDAECHRAVRAALELLTTGRSVILHSCRGPNDLRVQPTVERLAESGSAYARSKIIGQALGRILDQVLRESGLQRAVVTGGDTSVYVARELGIEALEMVAPLAPGSPLCRIVTSGSLLEGREITFKGGQVGRTDFFQDVLEGASSA